MTYETEGSMIESSENFKANLVQTKMKNRIGRLF